MAEIKRMFWNVFVWRSQHTLQILTNSQHSSGTDIVTIWERKEMKELFCCKQVCGWAGSRVQLTTTVLLLAGMLCSHSKECRICLLCLLVTLQVQDENWNDYSSSFNSQDLRTKPFSLHLWFQRSQMSLSEAHHCAFAPLFTNSNINITFKWISQMHKQQTI